MPEYHIGNHIVGDIKQAFEIATIRSIASGGEEFTIDVIIFDEFDAKIYGGDDAVERYKEDPDASVFERIVITAKSQGMIS